MLLLLISVVAFGLFLFFDKVLLPNAKKSDFSESKFPEATKVAVASVCAYASRFLFILSFTYFSFWLVLAIAKLFSESFPSAEGLVNGSLSLLTGFMNFFNVVASEKAGWGLLILLVVFAFLIMRNARAKVTSAYNALKKRQLEGNLPFIEFSDAMNDAEARMHNVVREYDNLKSIDPQQLNKGENEKLRQYLSSYEQAIGALQNWIRELDIRRRIVPLLAADEEKFIPKSWKDKVALFLSSRGMITSISKTNRFLANVGVGLLVVSFVSMTGKSVSSQIMTDSALIYEIQLAEQNKDFENKIKALAEEIEPEGEWEEEDERVADELAQVFERQHFRVFSQYPQSFSASEAFHTNSGAVREQIIHDFATTGEGVFREGFDFERQGDNWTTTSESDELAKKWNERFADNVRSKGPATHAGKQFKSSLREQAKRNPRKWASVRASFSFFVDDFSKPAKFSEVAEMVMGEFFEESLDGFMPERSVFGDLTKKVGKNYVKEYTKNSIEKATLKIFTNPESVANAEEIFKSSSSAEDFYKTAVKSNDWDFSPVRNKIAEIGTNYSTALNHIDINADEALVSKKSIEDLATSRNANKAVLAEAISDFKYHFPGQLGDETRTIAGELIGTVLDEVVEGAGHVAADIPSIRARNFNFLRGFRRIGGVLIGQEPLNSSTLLKFVNISWAASGVDSYEIFLHRADGKRISAGVYQKDIIHQALAYAADGRPVSTTMISAKPIPYLKILVHPALVNTQLGCQSVGLDRLVEKYAGRKINRDINSARLQEFLYTYVVFKIAKANNPSAERIGERVREYKSNISEKWSEIYGLLDGGNVFSSADKSHLVAKPEYFNKTIVGELRKALIKSNNNYNNFETSIEAFSWKFRSRPEAVSDLLLKAQTEQWSGVRERSFKLDNDLTFLRNPNPNDRLYPLDFIQQVVFVPAPSKAGSEKVDKNPWEFPLLKRSGTINKAVSLGILTDSRDMLLIDRMRSFTQIQRVFRLAFEGNMGYQFPVAKLSQLANATRASLGKIETPTWNLNWRPGEEELYMLSLDEASRTSLRKLMVSQKVNVQKNRQPCN